MDCSCCSACVEAEPACDHVRRSYSAVPIRTGIKRVSHPEEKRGGIPLPPLGNQTITSSSMASVRSAGVRLKDRMKSTAREAWEATLKMNFGSLFKVSMKC